MASLLMVSSYPARMCGVSDYTHQIVRRLPSDLRCRTLPLDLRRGAIAYMRDFGAVMAALLRTRPGSVHIQYTPTTSGPSLPLIVWTARHLARANVVITAHEQPSTYERRLPRPAVAAFRAWEALSLKPAARVIVLSRAHQQELRARYRIECDVFHHGMDAESAAPNVVPDARATLPCITFAGFIRPSKGVDDLVQAAPRIGARIGPCRVSIVGATAERDSAYGVALRRLVDDAGVDACHVEMTGSVSDDEFGQRIAATDVFVFPFRGVSQSNTFNRAVGACIPVVAADAGGVADDVREHGLGLTYPAGDISALADAVCRLLEDRELYEACRARARTYAAASDWRIIARRHVDLYALRDAA